MEARTTTFNPDVRRLRKKFLTDTYIIESVHGLACAAIVKGLSESSKANPVIAESIAAVIAAPP